MLRWVLILYGLTVAVPLAAAKAQEPKPAEQTKAVNPSAVVAEVRQIIAERYILPERRPALDAVLAQGLASGRYDVRDPAVLAERINADLDRVGRDKHLNFRYDPQEVARRTASNTGTNAAPGASTNERWARVRNHGITELRVLPGNIRYMAYDGCRWLGAESAAAIDHAMRFLGDGDAVIVDLRRNGGGSASACNYLISYFLPAKQKLHTFYSQGGARSSDGFTVAELGAKRLVGKPLYVLISATTGSAAEAVAGNVRGFRVGELVGENTAGAGYSNVNLPVGGLFMLSVSVMRVTLASTGRDWEGVGFAPTIPSPAPLAVDVAHAHALRRLAATAPAQERPDLEATAEWLSARMEPRKAALPLAAYAGSFGERMVKLEQGKLYYESGEGPRTLLVPLGGNAFVLDDEPLTRIQFLASGDRVTAVEVLRAGGPAGRYQRTQ